MSWFERSLLRFKLLFGRIRTGKVLVGVVIRRGHEYLLIEEWQNGKWCLNIPAGHLEPRETPIEGARREAKEESGLEVRLTGMRLMLCNTWDKGFHSVYYIFDAEPCGGALSPEKGATAGWFTLEAWEKRMQEIEPMPAIPPIFEAVKKGWYLSTEAMYFIDRRHGRSRELLSYDSGT